MKLTPLFSLLLLSLSACAFGAQKEHQKVEGEKAFADDGRAALEAGRIESKEVEGTTVARVKSDLSQWGFVHYWMGIPTPAGSATVRMRVYHTEEETAQFAVYISHSGGQKGPITFEIPEDAAVDSFVEIDVPVEHDAEWSGVTLKKMEASDHPGIWIDSVSVLLEN